MSLDRLKRLALATAVASLLAVGCGASSDGADSTAADSAPVKASVTSEADTGATPSLPDVSGTLVSGGQFELNDLAGQDVVLWFWAPW